MTPTSYLVTLHIAPTSTGTMIALRRLLQTEGELIALIERYGHTLLGLSVTPEDTEAEYTEETNDTD